MNNKQKQLKEIDILNIIIESSTFDNYENFNIKKLKIDNICSSNK